MSSLKTPDKVEGAEYPREANKSEKSNSKEMPKAPSEIWDLITNYLPAHSALIASKVCDFELRKIQERQGQLWNSIFKDFKWINTLFNDFRINPILIGRDLHHYHNIKGIKATSPSYLVLIAGDRSGDLRFKKQRFLKSLLQHRFNDKTFELTFKKTGLTLNIANIWPDREIIPAKLKKLFSYENKHLRTAYLHWQDNKPVLRTLEPSNIVGIGGKAI